jgi:expansin (peptidoglycan-binding protein)
VQLTNGGKSVVATVIDECPASSNSVCSQVSDPTHLDVSTSAFDQLGYSVGDPSNTTWKFVPCPVSGGVVVRVKSGNPNEIYIENVVLPVASVTLNGQAATHTAYGSWHWSNNLAAGSVLTITDIDGASITVTLASTSQDQNQQMSAQFPTCSD